MTASGETGESRRRAGSGYNWSNTKKRTERQHLKENELQTFARQAREQIESRRRETTAIIAIAVLLAAVVGGWAWGALADRFGRKPVFVGSLLLLAGASFGLAFTPDGAWMYMVVMRGIIGFCTGGFFIQVALVQEFIPPKRRGMLTGVVSAITTGGLLLGAFSGAYLIPSIGWRWTWHRASAAPAAPA